MRVTINRKALLGYLKSVIRVVPQNNAIMELMGFMIECNEDNGYMYITASNLETTIQRKIKASVAQGGSFVVAAKMFLGITDRLGGEEIMLEYDGKLLGITSERCRFDIPVLSARNYPKINIPYPDDLVKIKGVCSMYSKTSTAVSNDSKRLSLTGIHLEMYSDTVQATGCDSFRMAVTEMKCECGGKLSVTVPKQSFFYLANAVEDKDVLEMGLAGNSLVFVKNDMLFSTRIISEPFMNIDRLLNMPDKKLVARVKAEDMTVMAQTVSMITSVSEDTAPVLLRLTDNGLKVSVESTETISTLDIVAEVVCNEECEFYYNAKYFSDMLKVIKGDVNLYMTGNGILYASNGISKYMLVNSKHRGVKLKTKKKQIRTKKAA